MNKLLNRLLVYILKNGYDFDSHSAEIVLQFIVSCPKDKSVTRIESYTDVTLGAADQTPTLEQNKPQDCD